MLLFMAMPFNPSDARLSSCVRLAFASVDRNCHERTPTETNSTVEVYNKSQVDLDNPSVSHGKERNLSFGSRCIKQYQELTSHY